jgi:ribosome-associated heat shock protein Hsp15
MEEGVRIDKWLWCVRIYKTRNQATMACKSGKVWIDDQAVKPSREVHPGITVRIRLTPLVKTVVVKERLDHRVSASLISQYLEDLTPTEEYDKLKNKKPVHFEFRPQGIGRPTKRERRGIDNLKKYLGLSDG